MRILFILFIAVSFADCSSHRTTQNSKRNKAVQTANKLCSIDLDGDGVFTAVELDEKPIPVQGQDQWIRDTFKDLIYPSKSTGVSGVAIVEIYIDAFGNLKEVKRITSPDEEIGATAKKAYAKGSQKGFSPAFYQGKPVACKCQHSMKFSLP